MCSSDLNKATMEIPSPTAGVVRKIRIKVGDKISEGSLILEMEKSEVSTNKDNNQTNEKADSTENSASPVPNHETPETYSGNVDIFCDVLVLGSGPGGYTAAFRAADLGQKVVMVERYERIGVYGMCRFIGTGVFARSLAHASALIGFGDIDRRMI